MNRKYRGTAAKMLIIMLAICVQIALKGCAGLTGFGATETAGIAAPNRQSEAADIAAQGVACLLFDPIHWSIEDSVQTVVEVKRHNQKLLNYCSGL